MTFARRCSRLYLGSEMFSALKLCCIQGCSANVNPDLRPHLVAFPNLGSDYDLQSLICGSVALDIIAEDRPEDDGVLCFTVVKICVEDMEEDSHGIRPPERLGASGLPSVTSRFLTGHSDRTLLACLLVLCHC